MRRRSLSALALTGALLATGCTERPSSGSRADAQRVPAFRETQPVPHGGDAADDPAIWVDPSDPARSTIIGTDKRGGLGVYDLRGRELQYLDGGRPNNVDLRHGFRLAGRETTVVAAEERDHNQILLFAVDPDTRRLRSIAAGRIPAGMEVYGSCMYRSAASGRFFVFVGSQTGRIRQFRLVARRGGRVGAIPVRSFDVGSRAEGCVADDATGDLYVAEETRGIWRYGAEPEAGGRRTLVDRTGAGGHLTADVEGLALADVGARERYLVASNQGRNSYTIYRRGDADRYVTTFRIRPGGQTDGVQDTDGIDATTRPLGGDFPTGLFVAQDGSNGGDNQNFKLVRWDLAGLVARAGSARSSLRAGAADVKQDAPSWATASVAAPEREDAAAVAANGFAYLIGGKPASGVAQATVHFAALNADGSTGAWAATTPLPAARQDHNAVVADGRLYVIGGGGPDATVYSAAINPDGPLGAWRSETTLPVALDDPASVVAGEHLYVTGGLNGSVRNVVYSARIDAGGGLGVWQPGPNPLPDGGRMEHTAFAHDGFLYVVGGGSTEDTVQDDVFFAPIDADGALGAWQAATDELPQARLDHTTVVSGGRAYVIGGVDEAFVAQSSVYSTPLHADGSTGAWVVETALPAAREDAATVEYGGYAYVFAGKGASAVTTTYSAKLPSVCPATPTPEP